MSNPEVEVPNLIKQYLPSPMRIRMGKIPEAVTIGGLQSSKYNN